MTPNKAMKRTSLPVIFSAYAESHKLRSAAYRGVRRQPMNRWIPKNRKAWIRLGSVALFCLLAPFAIELVFLVDVVGVEAAIVFLFVYMKSVLIALRERYILAKAVVLDSIQAPVGHHLFGGKAYVVNVIASGLALWTTGSLVITLSVWLPSLVMYQYG